jgi:hypothetical protein
MGCALRDVQFIVNNTMNRSIGCSPAKLLFGIDQNGLPDEQLRENLLRLEQPIEVPEDRDKLRETALALSDKTRAYNKEAFDKRHKSLRNINRVNM